MTFTIHITCDNDAFTPTPSAEIARILRDTAEILENDNETAGPLVDINGNRVGQFELSTSTAS